MSVVWVGVETVSFLSGTIEVGELVFEGVLTENRFAPTGDRGGLSASTGELSNLCTSGHFPDNWSFRSLSFAPDGLMFSVLGRLAVTLSARFAANLLSLCASPFFTILWLLSLTLSFISPIRSRSKSPRLPSESGVVASSSSIG